MDWDLPDAANRGDILLATERAFLHPRLRAFYQDYFFDNALRYLNAQATLNDPLHPLPPAVQKRIQHALQLSRENEIGKRGSSAQKTYVELSDLLAGELSS
jgi:hypothetical protein